MCNCGCNICEIKSKPLLLNENVARKTILSEGLKHHLDTDKPLTEHLYRAGSRAYFDLWAEARYMYTRGILEFNHEDDLTILTETDLGNYGVYEGKKVPLDFIFEEEEEEETVTFEKSKKNPHNTIIARVGKKLAGFITVKPFSQDNKFKQVDTIRVYDAWRGKGVGLYLYLTANDYFGPIYSDDDTTSDAQKTWGKLVDAGYARKEGEYWVMNPSDQPMTEAKKKKKKKNPPLNKPKRGGSKAYYVYVKDPKTKNIKKVSFGSGGLKAKINNPKARQAFAKRHKCSTKKDKTKAGYWSCRLPRYAKQLGLKSNFSGFW